MQVNNSAAIANSLNYFKKSIVEGFNILKSATTLKK